MQAIINFCEQTGFYQFFQGDNWKCAIMIVVAIVLLFLGIVKKFEPLLLVPIAVGMLVTNLPGAEMYHEILFAGGHIHWDLFGGNPITAEFIAEMQASGVSEAVLSGVAVGQTVSVGLIDVLYLGISGGISGSCWGVGVQCRELEEKYGSDRIAVLDTRGASLGEGLVVI